MDKAGQNIVINWRQFITWTIARHQLSGGIEPRILIRSAVVASAYRLRTLPVSAPAHDTVKEEPHIVDKHLFVSMLAGARVPEDDNQLVLASTQRVCDVLLGSHCGSP